jgi:hypothetical protein
MANTLSSEAFNKLAVPGKQFVLFVYFFDRVHPNKSIRISLSSRKKGKDTSGSIYHAEEGKWPAVVETFRIDKKLGASEIYANLFINSQYVSSQQFK